jgi:rhamnogalacturonyl hydrolase YesR
MFLYGMARCRNLNLLEIPYTDTMRKAWAALATQIDSKGRVIGISEGTGPSDKPGYVARKVGTYTWGTGAYLLAACAYAETGLQPDT